MIIDAVTSHQKEIKIVKSREQISFSQDSNESNVIESGQNLEPSQISHTEEDLLEEHKREIDHEIDSENQTVDTNIHSIMPPVKKKSFSNSNLNPYKNQIIKKDETPKPDQIIPNANNIVSESDLTDQNSAHLNSIDPFQSRNGYPAERESIQRLTRERRNTQVTQIGLNTENFTACSFDHRLNPDSSEEEIKMERSSSPVRRFEFNRSPIGKRGKRDSISHTS